MKKRKTKEIVFFYTDLKFKEYVKKHNNTLYKKSSFLKGKISDFKDKYVFSEVRVLSVFIDEILDKKVLEMFPNLEFIMTRSTGVDHISQVYCQKNKIKIGNVPEYGSQTVAEFTLTILLYILKNIGSSSEKNRGFDLQGKTVGIVGLGKIGKYFAKLLMPFGVKIIAYDPYFDEQFAKANNIQKVTLNKLVSSADIISIHAPLVESTFHMIGKEEFKKMKKGVYLVNTARGGVVDTKFLFNALKNDIIRKAALDVLEDEHNLEFKSTNGLTKKQKEIFVWNKKILKMKNVLWTNHQAYNTFEAVHRIWDETIIKINEFIK